MYQDRLHIVMSCLGMPFDGNTIKTDTLGGSETAAYYMAREFAKRGHKVVMFTNCTEEGTFDGVQYVPAGATSAQAPLGATFHFYAEQTPHDVCIAQRHPAAFRHKLASKMNYWWVHDLALKRTYNDVAGMSWNIDAVLCVSEYHKSQLNHVYEIPTDRLVVVTNGVDPELVAAAEPIPGPLGVTGGLKLFYMSRPERGLENLVCKGGIMDQLPNHDLYFCTYNNVAEQMVGYYKEMWERAESMPNVHNLGFLTKERLYSFMKSMDLLVYPTPSSAMPDFREVSCIAAMEAMHCGLPMLTTSKGALPETTLNSGTIYGKSKEFPEIINGLTGEKLASLRELQSEACEKYTWSISCDKILADIEQRCTMDSVKYTRLAKDYIRHSGISNLIGRLNVGGVSSSYALSIEKAIAGSRVLAGAEFSQINQGIEDELKECYDFFVEDSYAKHYADYYTYEKDRGVHYGPEELDGNPRFEEVSSMVSMVKSSGSVLDYGCAHGHYTINLAKRYPSMFFYGVDISQSNIDKAKVWAEKDGVTNVAFYCGEWDHELSIFTSFDLPEVDCILCSEVLEHVQHPEALIRSLVTAKCLPQTGRVIITTPYGPWEAMGYDKHWPFRAHVHDFTRMDIEHIYGSMPEFELRTVPSGSTERGEPIGSYVYTFCTAGSYEGFVYPIFNRWPVIAGQGHTTGLSTRVRANGAEQTVSLCMIVREGWYDLARCLASVVGLPSEVLIGFDKEGDPEMTQVSIDVAQSFCRDHHIPFAYFVGPSPTDTGFDVARNEVIKHATGDWILWLDADEVLSGGEYIHKFLRNNLFDSYAIDQHHFSMQPAGVIKTDHPAKLFRRSTGAKFIGRIHEHPETEVNKGVGRTFQLPGVSIGHYGYSDESIRRGRFGRNYGLMLQDRTDYPDRHLGKFLWMRDMSQSCVFLTEKGLGGSPDFKDCWSKGVEAWKEVLQLGNVRMIAEGCKFYTELVRLSGLPYVMIVLDLGVTNDVGKTTMSVECLFFTSAEAAEFVALVTKLKLESLPTDYMQVTKWEDTLVQQTL